MKVTKDNLIIIVYTLNVGGKSATRAKEQMTSFMQVASIRKKLEVRRDVELDVEIQEIYLPVKDQPSKVECIYPALSGKELNKRLLAIEKQLQEIE